MSDQCAFCKSANQREFPSEICIHFPGIDSSTRPAEFVFPQILICLECGVAQFPIPDAELERLAEVDSESESDQVAA